MRTYSVLREGGDPSPAFEIENAYISPGVIARLLAEVENVTDIRQRKMFARQGDVHIEFRYQGKPYIVWEPYGDSSRYWIGPKDSLDVRDDTRRLEESFKQYTPPFHRAILGDILTLRFITRFFGPTKGVESHKGPE